MKFISGFQPETRVNFKLGYHPKTFNHYPQQIIISKLIIYLTCDRIPTRVHGGTNFHLSKQAPPRLQINELQIYLQLNMQEYQN